MTKTPRKAAPRAANLTTGQIRSGLPFLRRRLEELRSFDPASVTSGHKAKLQTLQTTLERTVNTVFGSDSHEYSELKSQRVWDLDHTIYAMIVGSFGETYTTPNAEIQQGVQEGLDNSIAILEATVIGLEEALEHAGFEQEPDERRADAESPIGDEVFIVHGHDKEAKTEVQLFLGRAGLNAIVLHEQANGGATIIEKFERHAGGAGFAIVLLTPDDHGGPVGGETVPRARQNVIGEMFWFAGRLGRKRVCALRKGNVEVPSDFAGLAYTEIDDRGAWKHELLKELQAAGYKVDWQKAFG